jgi:hypothetical protein
LVLFSLVFLAVWFRSSCVGFCHKKVAKFRIPPSPPYKDRNWLINK